MSKRTFEIVIWAATGFTGRLVMEYMAETYGIDGELNWAVAARNAVKLAEVKREIFERKLTSGPILLRIIKIRNPCTLRFQRQVRCVQSLDPMRFLASY